MWNAQVTQTGGGCDAEILRQEAGAGDAADERADVVREFFRKLLEQDDVADREVAAWLEDTRDLAENSGLIGR